MGGHYAVLSAFHGCSAACKRWPSGQVLIHGSSAVLNGSVLSVDFTHRLVAYVMKTAIYETNEAKSLRSAS